MGNSCCIFFFIFLNFFFHFQKCSLAGLAIIVPYAAAQVSGGYVNSGKYNFCNGIFVLGLLKERRSPERRSERALRKSVKRLERHSQNSAGAEAGAPLRFKPERGRSATNAPSERK